MLDDGHKSRSARGLTARLPFAEAIDHDLRETALADVAAKKQEKLIAKMASDW